MDSSRKATPMRIAFALAMVGCPAAVHAETLRVSGIYPAGNDRAAALRSIEIDRFGGLDGPALSIRIDDVLRGVTIEGRPWFDIRAA